MEGKKRVLIFVPVFPRLSETFIDREISKLVQRGNVDVRVFSLEEGLGVVSNNLKDCITYKKLDLFTQVIALFTFAPKAGVIIKVFRDTKDSGKGFFGKAYLFLKAIGYAKLFSRYHPDILFAHFMSTPSTIVMIASKLLDIPYAISAHAKDITVDAEYIDEKIKTAKFITICNRNAYDYILRVSKVAEPENVYLIYHGVDVDSLVNQVPPIKTEKSVPLLMSIGRLVEKKGYKYLIEASKILKDRNISHQLKIIAGGPLYQDLVMQIKKLGLEDTVEIVGNGNGLIFTEAVKYYRVADVFVSPSIETSSGDVEGVANVLLESAAFKVPIVSCDSGGTTELVANNETGLVVPQRDPEKLADAIQVIIQDKNLVKKITDGAYNKVLESFNLDSNVKNIEQLLIV